MREATCGWWLSYQNEAAVIGQGWAESPASSRIFPRAARCGIVGLDGEGLGKVLFCRVTVAEFLAQPGQFDFGVGRGGLLVHPAFDEAKGLLRAPSSASKTARPR